MKEPTWDECSADELWRYVAWHLEDAGIHSVLVGGAVVSIYTEGLYVSGDLDIVTDGTARSKLEEVLKGIGFEPSRSRYYKHPQCKHLYLEFPPGPVEIGEEAPIDPHEIEVEGKTLRLLSPTDSVKDRLAGYIHFGSRPNFDQAVLICQRQEPRVNLNAVRKWCEREGHLPAFEELRDYLLRSQNGEV